MEDRMASRMEAQKAHATQYLLEALDAIAVNAAREAASLRSSGYCSVNGIASQVTRALEYNGRLEAIDRISG